MIKQVPVIWEGCGGAAQDRVTAEVGGRGAMAQDTQTSNLANAGFQNCRNLFYLKAGAGWSLRWPGAGLPRTGGAGWEQGGLQEQREEGRKGE